MNVPATQAGTGASKLAFRISALLMAVALVLGGSQSKPLFLLMVELTAVAVLVAIMASRSEYALQRMHLVAISLLLLILLTPLLQLVPLPPSFWHSQPGRELALRVDALVGLEGWRPLTLDRMGTWKAFIGLLPAAAMFLATLRLSQKDRFRLTLVLIAGATLSLLLALIQLGTTAGSFRFYGGGHDHLPVGLFANRNHQADLLLIAMPFFSVLVLRHVRTVFPNRWLIWLVAMMVLSAGVIATSSRMGLILLPLMLIGSLFILLRTDEPRRSSRPLHRPAVLVVVAVGITLAAIAASSGAMGRVLTRFQTLTDGRFEFWPNVIYSARLFSPWGSGLGTFDPVYRSIEDLQSLGPNYVNHAHSDYLEIWLETGYWGLFLVTVFLLLYVYRAAAGSEAGRNPLHFAATFGIFVLLVHSLVDYPLRTNALMVTLAFMFGLLFPPLSGSPGNRPTGSVAPRRTIRRAAINRPMRVTGRRT